MKTKITPTSILVWVLSLILLVLSASVTLAQDTPVEIRIGYQRGGLATVLQVQQRLEARFGSTVTVS
jgi:hypothetical protein